MFTHDPPRKKRGWKRPSRAKQVYTGWHPRVGTGQAERDRWYADEEQPLEEEAYYYPPVEEPLYGPRLDELGPEPDFRFPDGLTPYYEEPEPPVGVEGLEGVGLEKPPPDPYFQPVFIDEAHGDYPMPNEILGDYFSGEPGDLPQRYRVRKTDSGLQVVETTPTPKPVEEEPEVPWYLQGDEEQIPMRLPRSVAATTRSPSELSEDRLALLGFSIPSEVPRLIWDPSTQETQRIGLKPMEIPLPPGWLLPYDVQEQVLTGQRALEPREIIDAATNTSWEIAKGVEQVWADQTEKLPLVGGSAAGALRSGFNLGSINPAMTGITISTAAVVQSFIDPVGLVVGGPLNAGSKAILGKVAEVVAPVALPLLGIPVAKVLGVPASKAIRALTSRKMGVIDRVPLRAFYNDAANTMIRIADAKVLVPATVAVPTVAGAVLGFATTDSNASPEERAFNTVKNAAIFGGAGLGSQLALRAGGKKLAEIAGSGVADTIEERFLAGTGKTVAQLSPITRRRYDAMLAAEKADAGLLTHASGGPFEYPGGATGYLWDSIFRQKVATDRLALAKTWEGRLQEIEHGTLPWNAKFGSLMQLMSGSKAAADHTIQSEVRPIFERYGMQDRARLDWFNQWYNAYTAEWLSNPARAVTKSMGKTTGNHADDVLALQEIADHITGKSKDPQIITQFEAFAHDLTKVYNTLLDEEEAVGLLAPGIAASLKQNRYIYSTARNVEQHALRSVPNTSERFTAVRQDVAPSATSKALVRNDFFGTVDHMKARMQLIEEQRVFQAMVEARRYDPDGWAKFFKPYTGGKETVPNGWDIIEGYIEGEKAQFLAPTDFQQVVMGLRPTEVGKFLKIAASIVYPFKLGATTLSLPFTIKNAFRDTEAAMANTGYTGSYLREGLRSFGAVLMQPEFQRLRERGPMTLAATVGGAVGFQPGSTEDPSWQERALVGGAAGLAAAAVTGRMHLPVDIWKGIDRLVGQGAIKQVGRYMKAGGRVGTISESLVPNYEHSAEFLLGFDPKAGAARKAFDVIMTPVDMMRMMSEVTELTSRANVFRVATSKGLADREAAYLARNATVDFSKSSEFMRAASMFFPFLNARTQGTLRSLQALRDDPGEYMARQAYLTAMPTAVLQSYWRANYSDQYDKISQDERDKYWLLPVGSYSDPRTGEAKPLYFKIPKDVMSVMVASPVEHIIDHFAHTQANGQPLDPSRRSERTLNKEFLGAILNMLPAAPSVQDAGDPKAWLRAIAGMNPMDALNAQLTANRNTFTGTDIVPDEQLGFPVAYRVGKNPRPSVMKLAEIMKGLGLDGDFIPAPAEQELIVRTFGTTAADWLLGAFDAVLEGLGTKGPAFERVRDTMGRPPDVSDAEWRQYLDRLTSPRAELPRYADFLRGVIGASGGQQTVAAKVSELPEQDRHRWEQTQGLYRDANDYVDNTIQPKKLEVFDDRKGKTHAQKLDAIDDLNHERSGAYEGLKSRYPAAIVDPKERADFKTRLPGVPIPAGLGANSADLPEGLDTNTLLVRYYNPRGVSDDQLMTLSPGQIDQLRRNELDAISAEFGTDPNTLEDYIKASQGGRTLPVLGVPAAFIEEATSRFLRPLSMTYTETNPDTGKEEIDPVLLREARRREIAVLANQWGMNADDLETRIQLRLAGELSHPEERSYQRALNAAADIRDPVKHAKYIDYTGQPISTTVAQERVWDQLIASNAGRSAKEVGPEIQELRDAKKRGEIQRLMIMWTHEDYQDYDKWFGRGRNMTTDEYDRYMSGAEPRYSVGGTTEWNAMDQFLAVYNRMPAGPTKKQYAELAKYYRSVALPGWQMRLKEIDEWQEEQLEESFEERRQLGGGQDVVGKGEAGDDEMGFRIEREESFDDDDEEDDSGDDDSSSDSPDEDGGSFDGDGSESDGDEPEGFSPAELSPEEDTDETRRIGDLGDFGDFTDDESVGERGAQQLGLDEPLREGIEEPDVEAPTTDFQQEDFGQRKEREWAEYDPLPEEHPPGEFLLVGQKPVDQAPVTDQGPPLDPDIELAQQMLLGAKSNPLLREEIQRLALDDWRTESGKSRPDPNNPGEMANFDRYVDNWVHIAASLDDTHLNGVNLIRQKMRQAAREQLRTQAAEREAAEKKTEETAPVQALGSTSNLGRFNVYRYTGPVDDRGQFSDNGVPREEMLDYLARGATQRGLNPRHVIETALREGAGAHNPVLRAFNGEPAWTPLQLHVFAEDTGISSAARSNPNLRPTAIATRGAQGGVGDRFMYETEQQLGVRLHPSDPKAWKLAFDFAMDEMALKGFSQWFAAPADAPRRGVGQALGFTDEAKAYAGIK